MQYVAVTFVVAIFFVSGRSTQAQSSGPASSHVEIRGSIRQTEPAWRKRWRDTARSGGERYVAR
jgi:hypothetical protein